MSFYAVFVAADLSYVPAEGDLEKVTAFLTTRGIVGSAMDQGGPVSGRGFSWGPGPNVSEAVWDEPSEVVLFMSPEPTLIGDCSGPLFETRFFVKFLEVVEEKEGFIALLQEVIGASLFTKVCFYQ